MIVTVDEDECIGCGRCEEECPVVFELNRELVSKIKQQPSSDNEDCAQAAADACPVAAISIK